MKKLLLYLSLITAAAAQPIPFPQDTIAYNELFNNRVFPAYDSQGKIHLTYTGQSGTNSATREIYYVKEEIDGSFTTTNITNNSVDDNYSTLSVGPDDKLHVVYEARDASNNFQIYYKNNYTGSFGQAIAITSGGLNKATPFSKAGTDSIVHIVYFTYTTGTDYAYYVTFDARDSTLGSPVTLATAEAGGDFEASLDVDHNNFVHIVVKAGGLSTGTLKYFTNVTGTLTETPTGVSAMVSNPKVLIDRGNKVHILYRNESNLRFYLTNNSSGSFNTPVPVTPTGQRPAFQQNLGLDTLNRIYIVYQSSASTSGKGFYFVYSDNGVVSDTMLVYDLTPEYVTRNNIAVIARSDGQMAIFYAPGGVRNTNVIADIFMKRGMLSDTPVELISLTGNAEGQNIILKWSTATELNNKGFTVERNSGSSWNEIGFVNGAGSSLSRNDYSFTDINPVPGKYLYRLKQVDFNGSFEYSDEIEVETALINSFSLQQNYPNPFNPSTIIKFTVPENFSGIRTTLKVFDALGREVKELFNSGESGSFEVQFDAAGLSSGIYFYVLRNSEFSEVRKMILIR